MSDFEIKPEKMPDNKTNLDIYFNELFAAGTTGFKKLAYELQREFRFGGSPDVSRIFIDRVAFDRENNTGRFRVVLDVDFTFGCEDVRTSKPGQTSEWTFKVDDTSGKIFFHSSPYADQRSTADEF